MGKKKHSRKRKTTVYCSVEGEREAIFLEYLKEIYSDLENMNFPDNPIKGGNSDQILNFAFKNCHFDRVWVNRKRLSIIEKISIKKY